MTVQKIGGKVKWRTLCGEEIGRVEGYRIWYDVRLDNGKNMLVASLSSELIDDNTTNERK